jgi:hypothetical protein
MIANQSDLVLQSEAVHSLEAKDNKRPRDLWPDESTPLADVFGGQIQLRLTCSACSAYTMHSLPIMSIELEVPEVSVD